MKVQLFLCGTSWMLTPEDSVSILLCMDEGFGWYIQTDWRGILAGSECPELVSSVEMPVPEEELLVEEEDPEREENPEHTSSGS